MILRAHPKTAARRVGKNPLGAPWPRVLARAAVALSVWGLMPLYAGDILRGGATISTTRKNAGARAKAGDEMAAKTQANAQDRLARTTQAVQAVSAMQSAARAAARSQTKNLGMDPNRPGHPLPHVPDGLGPGGLDILGAPTGAHAPSQTASGSGVTVTVKQTAQQALLNWKTFNVGKNTTLHFDQKGGKSDSSKWIAFNKVTDPSGSPSQILGSIKAEGQVYIVNQNGIIFGGASQVNVRTLVASSLPINDNLVSAGLLNNPDSQFLFSALALPAGAKGTPEFIPPAVLTPNGRVGDVTVMPGAKLAAPTTAAGVGGRVMLVGANVNNAGTISTPDGQTILAAGLQVGIDAHASSDPSLRGLDVFVGDVGTYAGSVRHSGLIDAARGNVTFAGKTLQQMGVIDSTTSVSRNGRIDFLANYGAVPNPRYDASQPSNGPRFLYQSTGAITLGANSVTRILPEWESTETAAGNELLLRSQINFQGKTIYLGNNAMVLAPNAQVRARAGVWKFTPSTTAPMSQFVLSSGQIYLDGGAFVDVAGTTGVTVPLEQNILTLQLRGAELADAPLQRDSLIRAVLLTIDIRKRGNYYGREWVGTPLGDATGYVGLIEKTVSQLTTAGGSVDFEAGGSVVLQPGSVVDVSGGWVRYEGGMVQTTRLLYQGRIVDIADATPDRLYDGFYTAKFTKTHAKWGVSKTYVNPLALTGAHYEESYVQGADGGSLSIAAPSMVLDGSLAGHTVEGPRQLRDTTSSSNLAKPGSLALAFRSQDYDTLLVNYPTPPTVVFQSGLMQTSAGGFSVDAAGNPAELDEDRRKRVYVSPDLFTDEGGGFGSLAVNNEDGDILVPKGVSVVTRPGGSLSLAGANIDIQGQVIAPGGSIALKAYDLSPYLAAIYRAAVDAGNPPPFTPEPDSSRGNVRLGPKALLSAAGMVVDDRLTSRTPENLAIRIHGGSIEVDAFAIQLAEGSKIDVSGGILVTARGTKFYGDGGALALRAGKDLNLGDIHGGQLSIAGAELLGYSRNRGASLTLQAPLMQIGGSALHETTFLVQPEFFNQGGFSSFTLIGLGALGATTGEYLPGLYIAPGTTIDPQVESVVGVPFGRRGGLELRRTLLPPESRAPVSLTFSAPGISGASGMIVRGDLVFSEGSVIRTGPLGQVALTGQTVNVLGSVFAPGGSITVSGASNSLPLFADDSAALTTVFIGPNTVLSAAGTVVYTPDPYGRRTGYVLPGGVISIAGNIVAAGGAVLDVSGASGILDLDPFVADAFAQFQVPVGSGLTRPLYSLRTVPTQVDSDGGTIILKGGQMLFSEATLRGFAGGPTALGGTLEVSSGRFYPEGTTAMPSDPNLVVTQNAGAIPWKLPSGRNVIGQAVVGANGTPVPGMGYFSIDTFAQGGFDALSLNGVVQFQGPVTINARRMIRVADGGFLYADSDVRLTAPYVALGMAFPDPVRPEDMVSPFGPLKFPPTYGPGRLSVNASLIDVGTLSLQNIGYAALVAENGDIRGSGTFHLAGELLLRAGQIYPVTASPFTIIAYDYLKDGTTTPGSIRVEAAGTRPLPFSAGGTLSLYASVIHQGGVLRAPLGAINLGWDGTGTAPVDLIAGNALPFPVTQNLTLAPGSVTSVSAVDPLTGAGMLLPYGTSLDGLSWIDPTGTDISAGGLPGKTISIGGVNVTVAGDATIDLRGGGDLYAYRWIEGNGGTVDILASSESFAVIPGYAFDYAPWNTFSGDEPGYVNASLRVGDRIFLAGGSGLPAGVYTLLPARYALLPGAYLVTPKSDAPRGSLALPDGSVRVSGYRYNALNTSRQVAALASQFEVASPAVVRARAEYADFYGNGFFLESALAAETSVPRRPVDGGHLILQATSSMVLQGNVMAQGAWGGRGGLVDIASTSDILIAGRGVTGGPGVLVLDAARLSAFGAESLLIGGFRTFAEDGVRVTVRTSSMTVDNAGAALSAPDVILVAKEDLILAPGARIEATGGFQGSADTLILGDKDVAGSGDGVLLRVSASPSAGIVREGLGSSTAPNMVIGANAHLAGTSLTLDSTYATSLDPTANLLARIIALNSGQISLQFDNPGTLLPTVGLVLAGDALQDLQSARSLSLLSYSSLDLYGTGTFAMSGKLALHAAEIRGFNTNGGSLMFAADSITIDNSPGRTGPGGVAALDGTLSFLADTIRLGANAVEVSHYAQLNLSASRGLLVEGAGSFHTDGALTALTPFLAGGAQAAYALTADGAMVVEAPLGNTAPALVGLGATLTLRGSSISVSSDILLPSGSVTLHATSGDLVVAGRVDVGGTAQYFYDQTRYTDAGEIKLIADAGSIVVTEDGVLDLAAHSGGGDAGLLTVSIPQGSFTMDGGLLGRGGAGGNNGSFALDVGVLPNLSSLNDLLSTASFDYSRSFRVRSGDVLVDGVARSRYFQLSADQGSIVVSGIIDASGETGGSITLQANGDLTLLAGSVLTVAGETFDNAGKGGSITLEGGAQRNGVAGPGSVDIQAGSTLDLSVASLVPGSANTPGTSAYFGQFSGKLHIRAPQNAAGTDLQVNAIDGTILGASSILVEGYRIYDLTASGGTITAAVQNSILTQGQSFLGANGTTSANYTTMLNRLLANNAGLESVFVLAPGAEIINRTGNLTLGTTTSTTTSDWNLAGFRFGPKGAAGVLTLRAAGNLVFYNALSDGFTPTLANSNTSWLYQARPTAQNPLLPVNEQSWSYRLVAGADLSAADYGQVRPLQELGANAGYLQLGKNNYSASGNNSSNSNSSANPPGNNALTSSALANRYQVIRTGSGDINIRTGRSVQLFNHFASIYTAGTLVADATMGGTFSVPTPNQAGGQLVLGANQQPTPYPARYTMAGGNVSIFAQENIEHVTRTPSGQVIADSQRQLPNNWLYRRGFIDPETGKFGIANFNDVASTTWWVDFSNFFQGVGALGGGNVTMVAGRDIANVDAVIPTNARMSGRDSAGNILAPSQAEFVELGGGDLLVRAGSNIDAGVYYVERGRGVLDAGQDIVTNSTRSASTGNVNSSNLILDSNTWLPTTLFVGKGGFDVSANGSVLLGPVGNSFLMPPGINNSFWYKTYFSTYSPEAYVNVSSLGGDVTLRQGVSVDGRVTPLLELWARRVQLLTPTSVSYYQPWLRLAENSVEPFGTLVSLLPPTLKATSFSGDINLVGNLTLSPAPLGTLEMLAAGAINGLMPNGVRAVASGQVVSWGASQVNVSDANPASIPGPYSPYAYQTIAGLNPGSAYTTQAGFLDFLSRLFWETGGTQGQSAVLETKQALHSPGLHAQDTQPVRLYAGQRNISGLTLFAPKFAHIFAGRDILDVAFYLQNLSESDVSIVTSGRDIIPYNAASPLRVAANRAGNLAFSAPLAGDIQIGGPGVLEVLAGRNLDLGTGSANADGTGVGITSIGNARNPYLSGGGAELIVGAGIALPTGLSGLDAEAFLARVLNGSQGAEFLAEAGGEMAGSWTELDPEQRARLALKVFYLVLRNAGRNFAEEGDAAYEAGFEAIRTLFGGKGGNGDILTRSRDIRTRAGGDISIFAPNGGLTMANTTIGSPLAPPGIITESGGNINIFANGSVDIGIGRIFTLRGGNEIIWSSTGDIAAGSSSKTVKSAAPTRVLIDPQSADVQTDLAGLATGGGIGVLATVKGIAPGDVDLIAPVGAIDAGDAGIRVSGNLNLAATEVRNASNINVGGQSAGVPSTAPVVAAPNVAGLTAASNTAGAATSAANEVAQQDRTPVEDIEQTPSLISVDVLGYGGGEEDDQDERE